MMLLVVIWMIFGIIATIVARSKGLRQPAWLFVGILMGPAGLMLIALKRMKTAGSGTQGRATRDILAACLGAAGLIAVAGILALSGIEPLRSVIAPGACREYVEIQDEQYWSKKIGKPPHAPRSFNVVFLNAEPPQGGTYVFSAFPGDKVLVVKKSDAGYLCFDRRTQREGWIRKEDVRRTLLLDDDSLRPCPE